MVRDSTIAYNIFGWSGSTFLPNPSTCWPTLSTDWVGNVHIDTNSTGIPTIQSQMTALGITSPTNSIVADYTNFWEAACAYNTWTNCVLKSTNPARGTGPDGSDPGADVLQIQDRIYRWSDQAGLLSTDMGIQRMAPNLATVQQGSKYTTLRFRRFNSGTCTVQLFTNANRSTAHSDTPSAASCVRSTSFTDGNEVTFAFGTTANLTASTKYFWKIIDGDRIMVGEFKTAAAGSGTWQCPVQIGSAATLTYSANADLSSPTVLPSATSFVVPTATGTLKYWQIGTNGKRGVCNAP
jgi:hypothetical protein